MWNISLKGDLHKAAQFGLIARCEIGRRQRHRCDLLDDAKRVDVKWHHDFIGTRDFAGVFKRLNCPPCKRVAIVPGGKLIALFAERGASHATRMLREWRRLLAVLLGKRPTVNGHKCRG